MRISPSPSPHPAGFVKPRVTECMKFLQDNAGNEDAVECGWRQTLEEDRAPLCLYLLQSQPLCHPEISMLKSWLPWWSCFIGGDFGRRWRMELPGWDDWFYIWDTQSSLAFSRREDTIRSVIQSEERLIWSHCENPFLLFIILWYCVTAAQEV